ncbi:DDE 3 domain containing protein, partial [Asbolus verrucosus]
MTITISVYKIHCLKTTQAGLLFARGSYRILFTDESYFSRGGTFNAHNYHIWAEENPHAITVRSFQRRFSVNLWGGILGNFL